MGVHVDLRNPICNRMVTDCPLLWNPRNQKAENPPDWFGVVCGSASAIQTRTADVSCWRKLLTRGSGANCWSEPRLLAKVWSGVAFSSRRVRQQNVAQYTHLNRMSFSVLQLVLDVRPITQQISAVHCDLVRVFVKEVTGYSETQLDFCADPRLIES